MSHTPCIGLLGFGEVGTTIANDLGSTGSRVQTYDLKFDDPDSGPSRAVRALPAVFACKSAAECVANCWLVISAVTADQAVEAAQSVADSCPADCWYLDLNSVAPGTRERAAGVIEANGGRYVECAVMSPIQPLGLASPMLLGGPFAKAFLEAIGDLGFDQGRFYSEQIGAASAAKLCRSVVVKGVEALVTESLLAAREYGVENTVLDSLQAMFPGVDWHLHAAYLLERTIRHGERRAAEMHEAAETVRGAGVPPLMSEACAQRQALSAQAEPELDEADLQVLLSNIARRAGEH